MQKWLLLLTHFYCNFPARRYLAKRRMLVFFELSKRRNIDESAAVGTMQMLARKFLARMHFLKMKVDIARSGEIREIAALRIQVQPMIILQANNLIPSNHSVLRTTFT